MEHFKYINPIRKPDGTLRDWKEYDALCVYEENIGYVNYNGSLEISRLRRDHPIAELLRLAQSIKDNEKRS